MVSKGRPARRRPIAGERRSSSASHAERPETAEEIEAQVSADIDAGLAVAPEPALEAPAPVEEPAAAASALPDTWGRPLVVVLAVLTVVAVAVFGVLAFRTLRTSDIDDARSGALAAARSAARVVLSYDHRHLDRDFKAARARLTGSFAEEYAATTTNVVKPTATQTKAIVVAEVRAASVVSATLDRVVTLLFVNQTTTSNRLKEPRTDLNRVRLTMDKLNGHWLVSDVDAL